MILITIGVVSIIFSVFWFMLYQHHKRKALQEWINFVEKYEKERRAMEGK
jgi:uncharacterized membrane protein YsdA (DUF1294 family)